MILVLCNSQYTGDDNRCQQALRGATPRGKKKLWVRFPGDYFYSSWLDGFPPNRPSALLEFQGTLDDLIGIRLRETQGVIRSIHVVDVQNRAQQLQVYRNNLAIMEAMGHMEFRARIDLELSVYLSPANAALRENLALSIHNLIG